MFDRVEDPEAGISIVSGHEHHFGLALALDKRIQAQNGLDKGKTCPRLEDVILMLDLILRILF